MAIVYSYPQATPTLSDTVLGTQFDYDGNPTKSFLIADILNLIPPATAGWSGSFDTSEILEITVVNGLITNVVISG